MSVNLHVSPQKLLSISRILKETEALEEAAIFDRIEIVGQGGVGLKGDEEISSRRSLVRIAGPSEDKAQGLWSRLVWFLMWSGRVIWRYRRVDVVCVNAHTLSVLPLCWVIAVLHRGRLVYDTHELETETTGLVGIRKPMAKLVERAFIRRCDLVVTVTTGIAAWYSDAYVGVCPLVVRNIPQIVETFAADVPDLRNEFGMADDEALFIHTGNVVEYRNIPLILESFAADDVRHHVLFLGSGRLEVDIRAAEADRPNIHLHAPVPHHEVVRWVGAADVGLCLIEPTSDSYRLALPNKVFETLGAGTALVSSFLTEAHELFGEGYLRSVLTDPKTDLPRLVHLSRRELMNRYDTSQWSSVLPTWVDEVEPMVRTIGALVRPSHG